MNLLKRTALLVALLFPFPILAQLSWEKLPSPSGTDGQEHIVMHEGTIFIISSFGSWRSEDSGAHWNRISSPPLPNTLLLLVDSTGTLIAGGENVSGVDPTLCFSTDGGMTWNLVETIQRTVAEGSMVIAPDGSWLLTSPNYLLRRSRNQGESWEEIDIPLGSSLSYHYSTIARFPSDQLAISFGELNNGKGYQLTSTDGGEEWMLKDSTPVYRYFPLAASLYYTLRISPLNKERLLIREDIERSERDTQFIETYLYRSYNVVQGSDDTLYAIAGPPYNTSSNLPYFYRSTDLGKSWNEGEPIPNAILYQMIVVDGKVLVCGTGGPFASTDGGTTWHVSSQGIIRNSVQDLQVLPTGQSHYVTGGGLSPIEEFGPEPDDHRTWINPVELFVPTLMTLSSSGSLFVTSNLRSLWRLSPGERQFSPVEVPFRDSTDNNEFAGRLAQAIGSMQFGGRDLVLLGLLSGGIDAYDVEGDYWHTYPRPNDYDAIHPISHLAVTREYIFTEVEGRIYRLAAEDLVSTQGDPDAWEEVLNVEAGVIAMNGTSTIEETFQV